MKSFLPRVDWLLVLPVSILIFLSLLTLLSLNVAFFRNQIFALIISIIAFFFISQINFHALKTMSIPIYVVSLVLLIIVLIIGIEARGAVRWVTVFGISLQFSELIKPFLALSLTGYLSGQSNRSPGTFVKIGLFLAPIFLLVYLQPDLGNALIYLFVTGFTMLFFGFPIVWFLLALLPFVVLSPFIWSRLHDYQRLRILTFLSPTSDPQGTSYNLIQAIIAVGSGQMIGKGFSQGTQSGLAFLPERHTDFIFASMAEGIGFVGALIVISAFIFLGYRIYRICIDAEDTFGRLFAASAFIIIFTNFFVNIGMNIGIVPVVGVTLPFVSAGGSSLLSNFILLGLLSAMGGRNRRNVLEIR